MQNILLCIHHHFLMGVWVVMMMVFDICMSGFMHVHIAVTVASAGSTHKNGFRRLFTFLAFAAEETIAGKQYNHGANGNNSVHGLGEIVEDAESVCFTMAGMGEGKKRENARSKKKFTFHI